MTGAANYQERLAQLVDVDFAVERGSPLPLGCTIATTGVNFAVVSHHATSMAIALFEPGGATPVIELPLDARFNRTGDVWHALVRGLAPGFGYGFRAGGPHQAPHCFDDSNVLLDPHARAVAGLGAWGDAPGPLRSVIVDAAFDWELDQPLNIPLDQTIVYEMHVRGFTKHPSSGVAHPGTFAGIIEKIPYLQSLGITAVELLPVTEFDETLTAGGHNPLTGERLLNLWGYHTLAFYAPKASFASASGALGEQVVEFKRLVKALHAAGIEVILDLVFNHTGEGPLDGPTSSFRGLDNALYYLTDPASGRYLDYSGCGNSLNCNHPVVRDLILDCLRYWVVDMHVDGFRFDLASVLGRGRDGAVLANPPLLERIAEDPILARTKLIAEAWDAAGLYQVGSFPASGRWGEWNGRYRDDIRQFLKGDAGLAGPVATRLAGSPDLYRHYGGGAHHGVNFITCHDGFTLRDLVSYNTKHNDANGEQSRDGCNANDSWNCGWEGPAAPADVDALRDRQVRNALLMLLLSQGVPMLLAGDEGGRSQSGNNNAYCQDSAVSWIDWSARDERLTQWVARLIAFRRAHPQLRDGRFYDPLPDGTRLVSWHGVRPLQPDWSAASRLVAFSVPELAEARAIFVAFNMHSESIDVELPKPATGQHWRLVTDSSDDRCRIDVGGAGDRIDGGGYRLNARTSMVLEAWRDHG
jgi:glycogen operon protein